MNILVISNQNNNKWSGPTYSIPKQVSSLARIDNVLWYNTNLDRSDEWNNTGCYVNLNDYPNMRIESLPSPFNNPDIAIVEQFYPYGKTRIINELIRKKIKYVIVPRGELTNDAQKRKRIKKIIANHLIFFRYSRNAEAIVYLTENEKTQSGLKWNTNSLVISNGIDIPVEKKQYNLPRNRIRCVAIGRISPYQKGLDLLIEACVMCKQDFMKNNCFIDIYGPDYDNEVQILKKSVCDNGMENNITFHDAVFGEEKKKVLLDCDVYLMTSRFEGHPLALIEALSYGIPCIATDGSNMRKEVDLFRAGWTANNSAEGIYKAFQEMFRSVSEFQYYGDNAKSLSERYNWDRIAQETHEKLARIIEG